MHVALIIVGAVIGLILSMGTVSNGLVGALLGGLVGYVLTELWSLRRRSDQFEKEVNALKERLAAAQRREREVRSGEDAAGARGVASERGAASGSEAWRYEEPASRAGEAPGAAPTSGATSASRDPHEEPTAPGVAQGSAPVESPRREKVGALVSPEAGESSSSGWTRATHAAATGVDASPTPASAAWGLPLDSAASGAPSDSPILRTIREYFTGGNTLVRVGILILFFGVAFLLRYIAEHSHVPVQFRLSGIALGGVALLVLGWRLRARRAGYALALQGGGIGILYLTTFAALRLYSLLPPGIAFALLVLLAALFALLAVLQDSQAFALLAVTGGFLAPILASTGEGSHVVLFSYYAVLNASILAIAWYKALRPLNLAGFTFTFIISTAWGVLHYNDSLFVSTEPFLVLFFVLYVAIAILFSVRQPPRLRGYVDGTLVFGTPMAAFGYQSGMLHDRPMALALSAVILGAAYFALAWALHRQQRSSQRLLVEVFMALGVVFLTIATPLALNSHESGTTWALEAVGLVWIGARQSRVLPRLFGTILLIVAGVLLWSDLGQIRNIEPTFGLYLARVLAAVAAVLAAAILSRYAHRLRSYEAVSAPLLFFFGIACWVLAGSTEIDWYVPNDSIWFAKVVFATLTALACSELSQRTALRLARLPALWLLPCLFLFAGKQFLSPVDHPFASAGWLAWLLAFAGFYVICRRHEGEPDGLRARWLHTPAAWLIVALLTWELHWCVEHLIGRGSWSAVALMLVPASALFALPRLVERVPWPLGTHPRAYVVFAGGGIAAYLACWSLGTNFSLPGDPYPFPYVPLLNALDLAQLLVILVLGRFWLYYRSERITSAENAPDPAPWLLAALAFVWLNAALLRTLHRWAAVPLDFEAAIHSTLVETSLSIFWTVLALATMLVATFRKTRPVWVTGACLLAVTILKLFLVDLSSVGTVERIVSFVGVGLLTLVIGYFSPLPPAATAPRTNAS